MDQGTKISQLKTTTYYTFVSITIPALNPKLCKRELKGIVVGLGIVLPITFRFFELSIPDDYSVEYHALSEEYSNTLTLSKLVVVQSCWKINPNHHAKRTDNNHTCKVDLL